MPLDENANCALSLATVLFCMEYPPAVGMNLCVEKIPHFLICCHTIFWLDNCDLQVMKHF